MDGGVSRPVSPDWQYYLLVVPSCAIDWLGGCSEKLLEVIVSVVVHNEEA
jgi:hypothetical protein